MRLVLRPAVKRMPFAWLAVALVLLAALVALALALGATSLLLRLTVIGLMLLLPGLALQSLLAPRWQGDLVETLSLALGLSLASYPLLLAWLTWLGGRWSPPLLAALLVACAMLVVARWWRRGLPPLDARAALLLGLILAAALVLRLDHVRGAVFPAWSDSYQHVVVSRLIMDGGRLPTSYRPLAEIDSFRYHFGFHTVTAFTGWLAGLEAHRAVLLVGQVLNALSCVTVYFFLAYGLGSRRAGVVGALIVGLLTIAPANYVNFGRYPQLAGQVLLPVPMALTLRTLLPEEGERPPWPLAVVTAAGLSLTHYRVTLFFVCFAAATLLLALAWRRRSAAQVLLAAGRLGGLAVLLVAPWLIHLALAFLSRFQRSTMIARSDQYHFISWRFLFTWGVAAPLVAAAGLGVVWAAVRREARVLVIALWVVLMFALANPRLWGLPTTFLDNGSVVLALYVPVGILVGYLAGQVLQALERRWGSGTALALLVVIVAVGSVVGLRTLNRRILEPWRFFVTPDDLRAAEWIRQNLPQDAFFAVQMYDEMGPVTVHGVDAGLWIPYMTGRRTTMPPMPYNGELSHEAADAINRRARDTFRLPQDHQALARLRAQGVTHAYVVQPRIFYQGLWQPDAFAADPAYRLLYHEGSVWIFALDGQP